MELVTRGAWRLTTTAMLNLKKQHLRPHAVVGYGIKICAQASLLRHQITWRGMDLWTENVFRNGDTVGTRNERFT